MITRTALLIMLALMLCVGANAQDTGQICIKAFQDLDASGGRTEDESAVVRGISASLLNALGVTMQTVLLEDAADAALGLLCFDALSGGDYRVMLSSAEYEAISATSFSAIVAPGEPPVVYEFGVSASQDDQQSASGPGGLFSDQRLRALEVIGIALIGGLIVSGAVFLLGLVIFFGVFRRRLRISRRRSLLQLAPYNSVAAAPETAPAFPDQPSVFAEDAPGGSSGLHRGSPKLFDYDDTDSFAQI